MAITDPNDLGTDVALLTDLAGVWGLSSGQLNLGYALARRYSTPRGGLSYDLDYGYDVPAWLNAAIAVGNPGGGALAALQAALTAESLKDPRVQSNSVTVTFADKRLRIENAIDTADGPFDLVLSAGDVSVDLLSINGIAIAAPPPTTSTAVIVGPVGKDGTPGIQGPPGTSGGSGTPSLELADARTMASSLGSEEVIFQWDAADFGALAAGSLTAEITASVFSAAGTATFKLRLGGSDGVADGTVLATITQAVAAFQAKNATGTFTNPTGLLFVKITAQSSGGSVDARMKGPTVTFR